MNENQKQLSALLASYQGEILPFKPFAQKKDRAKWEAIPVDIREAKIAEAKKLLNYEYPTIPAVSFLNFTRKGDGSSFQKVFGPRRRVLATFVLAECYEGKGTFMDDIINGVMAICEESGWLVPAHNFYDQKGKRYELPDVKRPVVELFSAETSTLVSMIAYLLEDDFNEISPMFIDRMKYEIERRIEVPYLSDFFWWMGDGKTKLINGTAWNTSNILISTLLCNTATEEAKRAILVQACDSLDKFMACYDEDGFCDEGSTYYYLAAISLMQAIRVLNTVTGGHFQSAYKLPQVKNMVTYIMDMHIIDDIYASHSDCASHITKDATRTYLAAKEINSPEMMQYAAMAARMHKEKGDNDHGNIYESLEYAWNAIEIDAIDVKTLLPRKDRYFANIGTWVGRGRELYFLSIGGDNTARHAHSDKGSFIVYKNGKPLFLDPGVETFGKKTFSSERFSLWPMQTAYHNVISFGEANQQMCGEGYRSKVLEARFSDDVSTLIYELAPLYETGVINRYQREIHFEKGKQLTIKDTLSAIPEGSFLALMTLTKPEYKDGYLYIDGEAVQIDGCTFGGSEEIILTDKKMLDDWGKSIYRTKMIVRESVLTIVMKD